MALTASWDFILTDLMGTVHGELTGASDRSVALPHLRLHTASFKIPMWHPLADTLVMTDTLLQCWRTDITDVRKLVFNGPVGAVEEQTDNTTQTVAATASSPLERLSRRIIGTTKAGIKFPATGETDLGLIARDILDTTNGQGFTGVDKGTYAASQNGATGVWYLKNVGEAIAELTTGLNSFEFEIEPTVPVYTGGLGGWPRLGLLNIAPLIGGVNRPDAIFEYGTPAANVTGYQRSVSRSGLLTKAFISVSGWPDSTAQDILTSTDAAAVTERGLYEAVVPDSGIMDDGLRQAVADYHVAIRKQPRQLVTFKPSSNARPAPFTDYNIGDYVRARAVVRGVTRFDAVFRVWGITFNLDSNGSESVELELMLP